MSFKRVTKKGAPDWLYERQGKSTISYWIRYRRDGLKIEERIDARTWIDARREGLRVLNSKHHKINSRLPKDLIRTADLCAELVQISKGKSKGTYQLTEIFFRKHLTPWLDKYAPYAHSLNASHWDSYKTQKRLENPNVTLFNHWKYWVMLFKHAAKKGIIRPTKLDYSEEREDFRKRGFVIPDDELKKILENANEVWRDRILIQRSTGMRPGEVRCLRKDRVDFKKCVISLHKEDTKNRKARSFNVSASVMEVLKRRNLIESPFFFPSRADAQKPMDRCLTGWENALARAGISNHYTPHDLRHTRATEMFSSGIPPALACYILGMSIEEAQKTYLHFKAEDTAFAVKEINFEKQSLKVVKDSDAG